MANKNEMVVLENTPIIEDDTTIVKKMMRNKKSTSEMIRALGKMWFNEDGSIDRSRIVKTFKLAGVTTKNGDEIRYQHVRNVLITPVKKS